MSELILARHGATPYNEAGIWTGLRDVDMSVKGRRDVEQSAEILAKHTIDLALSSALVQARRTAKIILANQLQHDIPLLETPSLNEKDYGVYTGRSKQEVRDEAGEELYMKIRRSWDYKIEEGESLQDVHHRVMPVHRNLVDRF